MLSERECRLSRCLLSTALPKFGARGVGASLLELVPAPTEDELSSTESVRAGDRGTVSDWYFDSGLCDLNSGGKRDSGWTCGKGGVPSNPRAPSGFAEPARYAFAFMCDEEEAGVERLKPIPEKEEVEGPSMSGRVSEFGPVNASSRVSPLRERVIRSACLRF